MKKRYRFGAVLLTAVVSAWILGGCRAAETGSDQEARNEQTAVEKTEDSMQTAALESFQETGKGEESKTESGDGNILIAYFAVAENSDVDAASSASMVTVNGAGVGRISYLAELISRKTGGDLFSIDAATVYPGNGEKLIDYAAEEQERDERPEILNHIENPEQYDTIFVGFPTWWYDLPQVMYSFFDEYDFSGKTIIPFNCHNGSRFSGTIGTIRQLEPEADVIDDGFTISEKNVAEAEGEMSAWLEGLGF